MNRRDIFSLINAANTQSSFLNENYVTSIEGFSRFADKAMGIPILVPADEKLFDFEQKDIFSLDGKDVLAMVYDLPDNSYVGFKHAFYNFNFLSKFQVKEKYKSFYTKVLKQNLNIVSSVKVLKKKYTKIGAFQTRNIPHFGHEKIIERLLEECDHVVINPVIGPKKKGDVTIECLTFIYKYLSRSKYKHKISFKPIYANMFYAGPREAMHHALLRERIGFSSFTVGRDHAGADGAYEPNMASDLIKQNIKKIKIQMLVHDGAAFCPECNNAILIGDCSHPINKMVDISGVDFRSSLKRRKLFTLADRPMQLQLQKLDGAIFE